MKRHERDGMHGSDCGLMMGNSGWRETNEERREGHGVFGVREERWKEKRRQWSENG